MKLNVIYIIYKKKYPWIVVALLWFVSLLSYLDRQMLASLRPFIAVDISELRSATNFGYLMGIFLWIYGVLSPISGIISDQVDKKWIIVFSLFIWSFVTLLMGFVTTFRQFYLLRILMGVSEALYFPAALSLIIDYHKSSTQSLAIGLHMTGVYLGSALGGFGAVIATVYTWRFAFIIFGFLGIAYSIILIFFLKEIKNSTILPYSVYNSNKFSMYGVKALFSNPSFWIILLYFAIPSLPGWALKNWLPTLFHTRLNMPMKIAGPMATLTLGGASLFGVIFGGVLADKWSIHNIRGRIYTSAIGLAIIIPSIFIISFSHLKIILIIASISFGIGFGMFDANNMPILCQFVPVQYRATAYGLLNMAGIFLGAYITEILGKSLDKGHFGIDLAKLALLVLGIVTIQLLFLRPPANKN